MLTFERTLPIEQLDSRILSRLTRESAFFDIETTGFSANSSMIYLIGFARLRGEVLVFTQLLAEDDNSEKELLSAFSDLLNDINTLISFNGVGFDMPFIQGRSRRYQLDDPFAGRNVLDIFKEVSAIRHLLNLPDHKQKTLEAFLGFNRTDLYNGGELIAVYKQYRQTRESDALSLLLLHNYEDLLGMTELMRLYAYRDFFRCFETDNIDFHTFEDTNGRESVEIYFYLKSTVAVPVSITVSLGFYYLNLTANRASLRIPLHRGEMLYFHEDYHNYYYIASEDQAIHKSLAAFVSKDNREKCHAYNCYTRRSGMFLPQPTCLFEPEYKNSIKDRAGWFEATPSFFQDPQALEKYIKCIFTAILSGR